MKKLRVETCVADPDVFGPPGYVSVTRYGSGSTSFYQAKIVRKTLISTTGTVLGLLFDFYL